MMNDTEENKETEEIVSFDFSAVKRFFGTKAFKVSLLVLLILIPAIFTIYIRLQPQQLPVTDDWARNSVTNYYKSAIAQQVNSQYPNLPTDQKQNLIDQQFNDFVKANKDSFENQVRQTSDYFKTGFRYEENNVTYTFLGDLDSYFYLRQARNLETKGSICDSIQDGKCVDSYILAPLGGYTTPTMHPYGIFYLHKILHAINPKINLMQASFLLPTVLAALGAVAAFFIGRRIMNDVAGFFAAMFVSLSPLFLTRTLGSDTDIWNVVLPLFIIWFFLELFEAKELWKKIFFAGLTGLFCGIFAFAWGGWWYIFDFIIATIVAYMIFELVRNYVKHRHHSKLWNADLRNTAIILGVFLVSSALFVTLFNSFDVFKGAIVQPFYLSSSLKVAAHADLWPNVFTTVAELNEASISSIVNQISFGANILFALAMMGIIFSLVKRKPGFREYALLAFSIVLSLVLISSSSLNMNPTLYLVLFMIPVAIALVLLLKEPGDLEVDIKPALLLTLWFVGMIYASTKGVRFILLLTPAFGIAIGVAIGYIFEYVATMVHRGSETTRYISRALIFIVLLLILLQPIKIGIAAGKSYVPSMTKGWWDSLSNIREKSSPDAIINSWWDFGHWFKYVADRRVTLDGVTQNHPNAHWLGQVLQTDDENRSVGLLRMMDCGSNNAFDEVNKRFNDTEISENIVSDIVVMSRQDAKAFLLSKGFPDSQAEDVLKYSHCNPPEDYFITSEDMVGKAGVWAHFGLWNFDKAYIVNNLRNKPVAEAVQVMKERWNYTDEEATRIYYDAQALQTDRDVNDWIAPWPSYATGNMVDCSIQSGIVLCNLNVAIGQSNGATIVLERSAVNMSDPAKSQVMLGFYDQTGRKVQQGGAALKEIAISTDTIRKYSVENSTIGLSLLLDVSTAGNQTKYRALVADPLLIDSTFTRLFFLDGKGMSRFEKFSDTTDITGTRIIVWKVRW